MAKNSIRDYSATNSSNTDIQSIDISEGCSPAGINNAIREVMADLKDVSTGAVALESPKFDSILDGNIKATDASGTDTAGTSTTIKGGAGTGTGTGGSIVFQVADGAGSTGSSVNAHATAVTITDDGNVGIGTSSPSAASNNAENLVINDSAGNSGVTIRTEAASGYSSIYFADSASYTVGRIEYQHGGDDMLFYTNGSEAMRIDSSGNLLVGTTIITGGIGNTTTGIRVGGSGVILASIDNSDAMTLNRNSSDGDIAVFRKDGSIVGSIGVASTDQFYFAAADGAGLKIDSDASSGCAPCNSSGANLDNSINVGHASNRWNDIYATNGTIQTSDQNEKQQIASLTSAEITAATAISKLFKTFKWNDKVAEKGDAARTHTGVIAQEVQTAMTDAGLDAGDYAFFISSTWWETQTEVPAVEAVEAVYEDVVIPAVLDEDGNEVEAERTEQRTVTEAVEAVDAYTRTDTYDTAEEAPEGATERTRLGIRYPELLAFVGAATEQRLADIETRLTALENA